MKNHQRVWLRLWLIRWSACTMGLQRVWQWSWTTRESYEDHGSSGGLTSTKTMGHQRLLLRPWITRGSYMYQDHGPSETLIETIDHQRVLHVPRPWAIRDSYWDHWSSEGLTRTKTMGHQRLLLRPWIIRGTYWDHRSSEDVIATLSLGVWVHASLCICCMWWGFRIVLEWLLTFWQYDCAERLCSAVLRRPTVGAYYCRFLEQYRKICSLPPSGEWCSIKRLLSDVNPVT